MNLQKPYIIALLALLCCALWGSAFPCIKIGYEWFDIQGAGSQILFAGWRFFLAGVMTFLFFSIKEKKPLTVQKRNIPAVIGQGFQQTTVQYFFFYLGLANTTATKGSVISAANVFFSVIIAHFIVKGEKITLKKAIGCIIGFAGVVAVNLTPEGFGSSFTLAGEGCVSPVRRGLRGKQCDDENNFKKRKAGGDYSLSADDRRKYSDNHRLCSRRKHGSFYC